METYRHSVPLRYSETFSVLYIPSLTRIPPLIISSTKTIRNFYFVDLSISTECLIQIRNAYVSNILRTYYLYNTGFYLGNSTYYTAISLFFLTYFFLLEVLLGQFVSTQCRREKTVLSYSKYNR